VRWEYLQSVGNFSSILFHNVGPALFISSVVIPPIPGALCFMNFFDYFTSMYVRHSISSDIARSFSSVIIVFSSVSS